MSSKNEKALNAFRNMNLNELATGNISIANCKFNEIKKIIEEVKSILNDDQLINELTSKQNNELTNNCANLLDNISQIETTINKIKLYL